MLKILPILVILTCSDGQLCTHPERKVYPMPDWDTCFKATAGMRFNPLPNEIEGEKVEIPFVMSAICAGREVLDDAASRWE